MKETVLITGGAGFIGSHLTNRLLKTRHYKIIIVDDLSTGLKNNLPEENQDLVFIKGDITDFSLMEEIFRKYDFNYIFHQAAIASVQESLDRPLRTHQVNNSATLMLLEFCRKYCNRIKRFIFAGSAAVFGDAPDLPKTENSPVKPMSPYGVDKYSSERYMINYYQLFGLPTTVLRYFNVYGPRQFSGSPYSGVISIFMKQFTQEQPQIVIYGDGKQSRDFVYIDDVVAANLTVMENPHAIGQVFHVGTGQQKSLLDMVDIFQKITRKQPKIDFQPERKGDIRHSIADISKLQELEFHPDYDLFTGLKAYFEYKTNKHLKG